MVPAHILSIEGEYATLEFSDGQTITIALDELPKNIAIDQEIVVNFGRSTDELARSIVNQLLGVSDVTKTS